MVPIDELQVREWLRTAQEHHRAGDLTAAGAAYTRLAAALPENAELRHLLGVVAWQRGEAALAAEHYRHALLLRPAFPQARNNLGIALKALGGLDAAAQSFEAALADDPGYAEAAYNLALAQQARGHDDLAEDAYRRALALRPAWPEALGNLGDFLRVRGRLVEAEPLLVEVARLRGDDAAACGNLALLRLDQGRHADAHALARRAVALSPETPLWWNAAGTAARLLQDASGAVAALERAAALAPGDAGTWLELGLAQQASGDDAAAHEALARARQLAPDSPRPPWAQVAALPACPDDEAHAASALARFDAFLAALECDAAHAVGEAAFEAAAAVLPFALHYLPGEQHERQRRYADAVARAARSACPWAAERPAASVRDGTRRVRVGFVSACLREHVVARFFGAFISGLDAREFERIVWYTGEQSDARTAVIAAAVDRFETHAGALPRLARSILDARLDVLVFPEVGSDPRQLALAALRLAPTQVALYGHPVTTGLDSVDWFVSGELMEPQGGEAHYREALVRLPGIGAQPWAPGSPGDGAWMRRLREGDRALLACPQNLMKMTPAFDAVLADVLALTRARLVLFDRNPRLSARFRARLAPALARRSVDVAEALHFEPLRSHAEFLGGLAEADLVLDTPGFSGGGTSLDALGTGAAVACFEGATARARQTSAMLRAIGLTTSIAPNEAGYAQMVAGLLEDRGRLAQLRAQIAQRSPALFGNAAAGLAFARFLRERAGPP